MNENIAMPVQRNSILIVDDEQFYLAFLKELLETDYDISIAKKGEQALRRAAAIPHPDLILLDVMMPEMDGYAVLNRLKSDPETSEIPVIFATAMGSEVDESKGLLLGAADYITKPFAPMVVQARVKTQLALQQSQQREREQNRQLALQNSELLALNQLKNQFIGMAAHDLRNPLAALQGISTLLLEAPQLQESVKREFLANIRNVSEQMLDLVNDLLDVSVIESGSFVLNRRHGSLAQLLAERVRLARFTAQTKRMTIEYNDNMIALAHFDAGRLAQVADNLLSNAIKFSPPGSRIWVELMDELDHVGFAVVDQGPGISEADVGRLFGQFQRLNNRPTGNEKSTGLGLAISHKIVAVHGGSIRVESVQGSGSRFIVTLPRS